MMSRARSLVVILSLAACEHASPSAEPLAPNQFRAAPTPPAPGIALPAEPAVEATVEPTEREEYQDYDDRPRSRAYRPWKGERPKIRIQTAKPAPTPADPANAVVKDASR